jgi:hypothetical protein
MSNADAAYNFDRYRQLLAEANDESKRLAFINLLIQERAKDRLAEQMVRAKVSELGLAADAPSSRAASLADGSGSASRESS